MQDLIVTLIQTELVWEDINANLERFEKLIDVIDDQTHLIVLPEMFSTGFSMNAENLAESMQGSAVRWLRKKAREKKADIAGSVIIAEDNNFYNRLCWVRPDGELMTYDKRHLFRYAGEEKVYTAGERNILVELNGWKIRPFVCYDLRFPAWTRNSGNRYDLALFIANWPAKRAAHWKILLQARAIENQAYVIGLNRIGTDGNGLYHSGDSSVIDPTGNIMFRNGHAACTYTVRLNYRFLQEYRTIFPAWKDADQPQNFL